MLCSKINIQLVPRSKHFISTAKAGQLMLCSKINIQLVPRSKHTLSRLQKPVS